RDFDPPAPFRIAASSQPAGRSGGIVVGVESVIDRNHDFTVVSRTTQVQDINSLVEQLVVESPTATLKQLAEKSGLTEWKVREALDRLKYRRQRGGKKGATHWTKETVTVAVGQVQTGDSEEADITLDQIAA
ncbi:MAG: hypothetical protein ABSG16_23425, partial [Candidatus Acidiferrum sp.]